MQLFPTFCPPTYPRRAAVLLGLLKARAGRGRFLKPGQASHSALPTHRAACKRQTHTHNNKTMGAEASAEAGAEVLAEAIGDMCFGLPPGTGMLLRAPIALGAAAAKAAAAPKPIHVHVGGGAAVTAAAAVGAASHVSVWRFYAIDATVSPYLTHWLVSTQVLARRRRDLARRLCRSEMRELSQRPTRQNSRDVPVHARGRDLRDDRHLFGA